ncbi:Predicted permease YjgP/YjgQ family [hydrothermal vent metagenome]|uniref:Predicted permease YjgP/YjgQ family n=1 Tax=hydrothermal vent metagenome TaxID=652676 RepID=A0A1W1BAB0_9ZZZZ
MVNARGYISSNFTKAFLTIFLPFFLIISLVYLVKISSLTAKIQISFLELLKLYSYSIPDIIFYTLPLSFIAALANVLIKLSTDNELIALYALGLKASKVLRGLLILGILFSLLLASISFLGMPLSKQFYKSFKESKKSEAKLNIVPGKLGQKFGDYYIYVKEKKAGKFHNIVIYNRTRKNEEQFFSSKKGELNKKNGATSLLLNDGYGYTYSDTKLQQAKYKTLEVYDSSRKKDFHFEDIIAYWSKAKTDEKMMHRVLFFIFVSLIPLLSVYLVASFTMINPRYQANRSFIVIFLTTLLLYMIASSLEKWGNFTILGITIVATFLLGKWLFKRRVAKYF